ncbi:hypothetical protein AB6A40_006614 [Gnathostoma spinigerum]|uniref:Beta-hexosaminidase eukaryotic type N-terminal domain-containing protein n=1 Tax=Gnathostoma spinigerum TaxID=75299 RepID=A0ABD6EUI3_9BILA
MWSFALIFIVISSETTVFGWPSVFNRSVGEIWPKPRSITQFPKVFRIDTKNFKIKGDTSCEIIKQAIKRYSIRFFPFENNTKWLETEQTTLDSLNIVVLDNCSSDLPIFGMDESYELDVTNTPATIRSREVWGALRGLESFSHMIYLNKNNGYEIKAARIMDSPRFPHRGVLLDTSRYTSSHTFVSYQ